MKTKTATLLLCVLALWRCYPLFWPGCLVGDSVVETPDGPRRMADLHVGDFIWAVRVEDGTRVARKVVNKVTRWSFDLRRPVVDGRTMHGVTSTHPFHDADHAQWITAGQLSSGMRVSTLLGARPLDDVEDEHAIIIPTWVHDIALEGPEHAFIADGVVVHNKSFMDPDAWFEDEALCRCFAEAAGLADRVTMVQTTASSSSASGFPGVDAGQGPDAGAVVTWCVVEDGALASPRWMDCSGRGISSAEGYFPNALEQVFLANNQVTRIAQSQFCQPNLHVLDLSGNPIEDSITLLNGICCFSNVVVKLHGTLLDSDDNANLAMLRERGCTVDPASF